MNFLYPPACSYTGDPRSICLGGATATSHPTSPGLGRLWPPGQLCHQPFSALKISRPLTRTGQEFDLSTAVSRCVYQPALSNPKLCIPSLVVVSRQWKNTKENHIAGQQDLCHSCWNSASTDNTGFWSGGNLPSPMGGETEGKKFLSNISSWAVLSFIL